VDFRIGKEEESMTHYTETGFNAGRPFCGINKEMAVVAGAKFMHVSYSDFVPSDLCPICKRIWEDAGSDNLETPEDDESSK